MIVYILMRKIPQFLSQKFSWLYKSVAECRETIMRFGDIGQFSSPDKGHQLLKAKVTKNNSK